MCGHVVAWVTRHDAGMPIVHFPSRRQHHVRSLGEVILVPPLLSCHVKNAPHGGAILPQLLALAAIHGNALAQVPQTGLPSWSAFDQHEVDTIDLSNLTVAVNISVMSKSGLFPISAAINMNSSVEIAGTAFASPLTNRNGYEIPLFVVNNSWLNGSLVATVAAGTEQIGVSCPTSGTTTKMWNYYVSTGDGTNHPLPVAGFTDTAGCLTGSGFTNAITIDGSGFIVTDSANGLTYTVYTKAGATLSGSSITDSNGNSITYTGSSHTFKDTMGEPEFVLSGTGSGQPMPTTITWPTLI